MHSRNLRVIVVVVATFAAIGCSPARSQPSNVAVPASSNVESAASTVAAPTAAAPDPVAVAIAYVASTDDLMGHSPVGRREIFRKLVAPTEVDTQAEAFEQAASELATTLGVPVERLVWVEVPITAKVVDSTSESASVDVWTVSILGAPSNGSPQQVWRTVHIAMELSSGRWLVTTATADQGPTPAANELAMQAGWKDFQVVSSWPAVVKGVGL
jgi:hypothetical protein